jgi:hypothetical protein
VTTVLVEPDALLATSADMLRTSADLAGVGLGVLSVAAALPPGAAIELGLEARALGARLQRLAAELTLEAERQSAVAAAAALADAMGGLKSFIGSRPASYWSRVIVVARFAIQETWSLFGRTLPFYVNVLGFGYRVERHGALVVARGRPPWEPGLLGDWIRSGRLDGRWFVLPDGRAEEELLNFTAGGGPRRIGAAAWRAVSHDAWAVRGADGASLVGRGAGRVSMLLSLAPDGFDYSPWGPHRHEGMASSGFASSVVTDLGFSLGQMAISAGAGAAVGTLGCPVAGTAVGFATGLVLGAVVEFTPGGRSARNAVQGAVKTDIDQSVDGGRRLLAMASQQAVAGPRPGGPAPGPWQLAPAAYPR